MSTTSTNLPSTATATPQGERGPKMTGADILVEALEREGVDTIFAYPGGASMAMHQALTRSKKIRTILPRHEQGGVFAAEGYARATGKAGVVHGDQRPGRDEPRDRHRRRLSRLHAAGGDHRAGAAGDDRQGRVSGDGRVLA